MGFYRDSISVDIWPRTQWGVFPFPQIDYLWEPAISVGEKQERSHMRLGEEWQV